MHRPVFDLTIYFIVFYVTTLLLVSACDSVSLRAYEMYKTIVLALILGLEGSIPFIIITFLGVCWIVNST
mgnify:CR=1 FL=1